MYAFISGDIVEVNPAYAVICSNGIGFQINISLNTYTSIKDVSVCQLFTHLIIREDAHTLYGFFTEQERNTFRHLISVGGVGPNTARMILSSLTNDEVNDAILNEDVSVFQKIKGIGLKSAQRIIIDLKDKVGKTFKTGDFSIPKHNTNRQEALSALILLGFNKSQADKALDRISKQLGENAGVEEIIKACLKVL